MNLAGEDLFFDNQIGMAKQVVTTASMYMSRGGFNEKNSGANTPKEALNKGFIEDDDLCYNNRVATLACRIFTLVGTGGPAPWRWPFPDR